MAAVPAGAQDEDTENMFIYSSYYECDATRLGDVDALVKKTAPLYDEAVRIVTETRKASISGVQRRLKIGYTRAARLIEQMNEGAGRVVSNHIGAENDDIAAGDGQAVGAGHHVVGIGNEQQIAALQVHTVRAAHGDVAADEVQPVDGHVATGRQRLQIHIGQHAAVGARRFEGEVRIADGEHIPGIPGRDPGNLAVVDV